MNKEKAKQKLKDLKNEIKSSTKDIEGLGDKLTDTDSRIIGPRNDIEFQKMRKDIKESNNGK